ncbi:hypothetical protein Ade02nite_71900 [Paractinoplanes deccanensis]|uniref:Major facilitator superfamily (MFS) profile domain-containing protein n=1 Tax=Paractinoplanes deccanensis TaxID=113561 RepID=A0ABQ3YEX0_9ACTN|nr:hypothetical protein Ade02nite_71900 [Actinoplanes deccanensis]
MPSLWRNREFNLLWIGRSLSDLGGAITGLAMPLLVLWLTGSAVQAGLVATVAQVTKVVSRLPAGFLADRIHRRFTLLACDAARLVAFALLAVTIATGQAGLATIIVVAVADAALTALFNATEHAALRSIVPPSQFPAAVARNEARSYGTSLAGPPLGGLLFGIAAAMPFAGNALSHLASLIGVALMREPLVAEAVERPARHVRAAEGVRFVSRNPFLRTVLIVAVPLNFALTGTIFTIIVTLQRQGVQPGVIGLTETIVGAGGLLGALAAPALHRRLPFALLIRWLCWGAVACLLTAALMTVSVASALPVAFAMFVGPACNAGLFGYQAAITPDFLQGRVLNVIFTTAMSATAVAPLVAGMLVSAWDPRATILVFTAAVVVSALAASLSPSIRRVRPSEEASHTVLPTEGPSMGMSR